MGLIKCPDCGNMVSDSAFSCPKCGRPMRKATRQDVDNNQQLAENSKPDFPPALFFIFSGRPSDFCISSIMVLPCGRIPQ